MNARHKYVVEEVKSVLGVNRVMKNTELCSTSFEGSNRLKCVSNAEINRMLVKEQCFEIKFVLSEAFMSLLLFTHYLGFKS